MNRALTDSGDRAAHLRESLERARHYLQTRYLGTPCEPDYRAMIARYETRLAALSPREGTS